MSIHETPSSIPSTSNPYSITEQILEERLRHPSYGRICPQIFAGTLACLSSLSFGTTLGWSHPVSQKIMFQDEIEVEDSDVILLMSIVLLGCSLGVSSGTLLMSQMGPKKALRAVGPFYILTWWLILTPSLNVQMAGRFFLGLLGVSYSTCGENLLFQTVHVGIRRYINVFHSSTVVLGVLVSHVVGMATSKHWLTIVCASIPIVHYILVQIVPESPVFLYATSHIAAAKSLAWYRGAGNYYMDMANIKRDWDAVRLDSEAYRYMLFSKAVYRALLVVVGVTFFQVSAGYFIFMFFSIRVWTLGKVVFTPLIDSTIMASCFVFTKLFWGSLHAVFSWKMRELLILSCLISAVALSLIAAYLALDTMKVDIFINRDWSPMVIVALFLFFYDMGLNHFPKILIFEYMPFQMYRKAFSLIQALLWLFAFLMVFGFASLFVQTPTYVVFICLAGLTYLGTLFCYMFVVEPKGKSLIQVQLEFGGNPIGKRGALFNQTKEIAEH